MRKKARVDANQNEIVETLRAVGATVLHLHQLGEGCPDICVGYRGENFLLELKDGSKPPSRRRLTDDEHEWHETWRGQVDTVADPVDALLVIGAIAGART